MIERRTLVMDPLLSNFLGIPVKGPFDKRSPTITKQRAGSHKEIKPSAINAFGPGHQQVFGKVDHKTL